VASVIGIAPVVASILVPWVYVHIETFVVTKDQAVFHQEATTETSVTEVWLWGYAYLPIVVLLVLASVAAVVMPQRRLQRPLGLVGLVAAFAVLADLGGAWFRLPAISDQAAERMAELARKVATMPAAHEPPTTWFAVNTDGMALALIGALVLGMVAACTVWPGTGSLVTAGVGTALVVVGVILPWVTVYRVTENGIETGNVGWFSLGTAALATVVAAVLLATLVWWAALRRSTRGRLPLLLLSLTFVVTAFIVADYSAYDPHIWMPAAELRRFVEVDHEVRAPAEMIQGSTLLLGLAAVLAWSAARRRAKQRG
jgi:hypothetical protein